MKNYAVISDMEFEEEELYQLTAEEDATLDRFYAGLARCGVTPDHGNTGEEGIYTFLWDDFRSLDVSIPTHERNNYSWYTLIEAEGEGWIVEGRRLVNRIGYFVATEKLDIGDGVRYW